MSNQIVPIIAERIRLYCNLTYLSTVQLVEYLKHQKWYQVELITKYIKYKIKRLVAEKTHVGNVFILCSDLLILQSVG